MSENILDDVNSLLQLGRGDIERLRYIKETLESNRTLYMSDKKYVEDLISKYLTKQQDDSEKPIMENLDESRTNTSSETIFCWKCGSSIESSQNFCSKCGASRTPSSEQNSSRTPSKKSSGTSTTSVFVAIVGVIILIFGILITAWSMTLPMILAGQYIIVGMLVLVIGGAIIFGASRIKKRNG